MRMIPPQVINLTSSNIPEALYVEWAAATTYAAGDKVYVTVESDGTTDRTPHKIYESLVSSNTGNYPPDDATKWLDCGATNRWAMFDNQVSSQTEGATTIEVEVAMTDWVDTVALFGLSGTKVQIVCATAALGTLSDVTYDLDQVIINNWYDYFFAPIEYADVLVADVPGGYNGMTITLTITGSPPKCGHMVVGRSNELGKTQYSPTIGIDDYSVKSVNDFGETTLTEREYAKTGSATISFPSAILDNVAARLTQSRATPTVWDLNNRGDAGTDYGRFVIFGFFNDFDILLQNFNTTTLSINIEGLI